MPSTVPAPGGKFRQWPDRRMIFDGLFPTWERNGSEGNMQERLVMRLRMHCDLTIDCVANAGFMAFVQMRTFATIAANLEVASTGAGVLVTFTPGASAIGNVWRMEECPFTHIAPGVGRLDLTFYYITAWVTTTP